MIARLRAALRRFLRREDGTATVEFVLCLPVIMFVFMASFESGIAMVRQTLLDRSTDMAMRDLRLGLYDDPSRDTLKDAICGEITMLINCRSQIVIDIRAISRSTWEMPEAGAPCLDRTTGIEDANELNVNQQNSIMLVRVCVMQDAIFPYTGIGLRMKVDETGYEIIVTSSFVNEPGIYNGDSDDTAAASNS